MQKQVKFHCIIFLHIILNITEKNDRHVTESFTGVTKNNTYTTGNNGLHRLSYAHMRENNTHE